MKIPFVALSLALCLSTGSAAPASPQMAGAGPQSVGDPADQSQAEQASDLSLEELANVEVYSASKRLQNVSDAPSSVTIVTSDEIQKFGYRTLADIMRSVPGFYITYDRNYSFVGVRGFGRLGDWNSRVLMLVDGHRLNNNVLGQAMLGTEFPIDVDLIDRVEIVRGPSSSLYGNSAFLAVINVITRKDPQVKGWELSFELGSFATYQGRASYGGRYRGLDLMLSGTFYNSEGPTLFFPEFNSPANNNGVVRNGADDVHEHMLATISFHGFTLQGMFSSREQGSPAAYFGTVFNDTRTRNTDDHQYFDLSYQRSMGEKWQFDARASYDQYRLVAPLATASPNPGGPVGVDVFSYRGNWWTNEVSLSRTLLERHKLTFGSEFRDNLRQDQGYFVSSANTFEQDRGSSWNWGFYAQDDFAITSKLSLSAGVRHDRYPRGAVTDKVTGQPPVTTALTSFGGTTNPRLGLIYHPYSKTTLKLLYGSAFRAPEVFESTPDLGTSLADNLALKPETIKSFEGVAEQRFGQHFKLSGSVFHNRVNQLITLEPDAVGGLLLYVNSQAVHATGTEIEFTGKSSRGLQGTASLSFVDADNNGLGNRPLSNSPGAMAKINVSVPLAKKNWVAGLEGQFVGPRITLAGNTVGAFQVFNLTLLGHPLDRHVDISASLYNLLAKQYADPARPEDPEDVIRQDGRTFRIKTTLRF